MGNFVTLADKAGFCFGVKRAVDTALDVKKQNNKKIYTLGQLIHNNDAVNYLKANDIFPIENIENLNEGDVVIIRSHGISPHVLNKLKEKKLTIIDATCPFVSKIQEKVKKYYDLGYNILIVGDKTHPEVIGINGWCNNNAIISKDGDGLNKLPSKLCVVSQTTEKQENWERVLSFVVKQCKEFVAFNTICNATEVRQKSAEYLSKKVDVMVVIGGRHSSNTTKLNEICKNNCKNTIHVENSGEIPESIYKNKNNLKIGVTAGASTPDWIIKEAIIKMSDDQNFQEMNDVIRMMDENEKKIFTGAAIKGEIISLNEKEAFLNIGYKADGLLPLSEVSTEANVKLTDIFAVGQEIDAKVIKLKNEDNYVVLSRIELEREAGYKEIEKANEDKSPISVTVKEAVNGGLVANYKGVRVFIPASHIELSHVNDLNEYIGKELQVSIIELSRKRNNTRIVASRRDLLKSEKDSHDKAVWENLEKGQVVDGEVKRLTDFGAFVDINGVDGLLHVSEISWGRINKASEVLKTGDKVKVIILDVSKENKKLSLSIKHLIDNPWNAADTKYPVGSVVLGKVVRFANFGAFVELEPGIDALVHISEISHKRIAKPSDVLKIGEEIKAKILDVNIETKKIGLSIKEVEEI
ncbi:MAG: bifunctional 4-hydroxy-3-methylbut-2-enyl diphosphate reductase/30S ribosomal protein S1 [Bacillota bacterium]|nr:bifunctional 4-hydroxy-3-methylbut-2-enyl diphosphate reductase/30S ribosomal protein S1 [Bacillota bacterium]